jgi:apolipoprotein N-acyltransferase
MLSYGWRRRLIAMGAGAIGALAMAPVDFLPAMVVPMTVAVWLLDGAAEAGRRRGATLSSAFQIGWWWGFGYFVAGLWWLGSAFLVEADKFAWALPLGVLGLPALLAFFPALGFVLARMLWSPGGARIFALASGLGLAEWLRGHVLTGFPWNMFGMALGDHLVTAQLASLIGLYGLTLVSIAIFAAPATLIDGIRRNAIAWLCLPLCIALLTFGGILAFGGMRLGLGQPPAVDGVKLRIMQPNIAQDAKFRPENGPAILAHYLSLSDRSTGPGHTGLSDVNLLIWPESAFPFILSQAPEALAQIGDALSPNTFLVTGAAREEEVTQDTGRLQTAFFNAIQVVAKGGVILDSYDKVHLVPFGEYLPFSTYLTKFGLRHFVQIPGGFEPGTRKKLLHIAGLPPAAPLVCYEAIFPEDIIPPTVPGQERAGFLLNVTNDAWFGATAGPYQHFAQARLRSIEQGLPLLRAANSGISAIVDPYGRVISSLGLGKEGVLDGRLPQRLAPPLYATFPFLSWFLVWIGMFAGALIFRLKV